MLFALLLHLLKHFPLQKVPCFSFCFAGKEKKDITFSMLKCASCLVTVKPSVYADFDACLGTCNTSEPLSLSYLINIFPASVSLNLALSRPVQVAGRRGWSDTTPQTV